MLQSRLSDYKHLILDDPDLVFIPIKGTDNQWVIDYITFPVPFFSEAIAACFFIFVTKFSQH